MRRKITIVGDDSLAAIAVLLLAERDYADLTLLDDQPPRSGRQAVSDLRHASALLGCESQVTLATQWDAVAGSGIVVLVDGGPGGVAAVAREVARVCPDAVVIVAAQGPEAVAVVLDGTLFPRQRVIGCRPLVDSARLREALATELGASVRDVQALVLGGPGKTAVPVLSSSTVAGTRAAERVAPDRLAALVRHACDDGASPGAFALAAAVREVVDAIVADAGRVLPCTVECRGEYGLDPVVLAVPCRLGAAGVEGIVELPLSETERAGLQGAAAELRPGQPVSERPPAAPAPAR